MSINIGKIPTLKTTPSPREQARKILEEAAEVFSAVEYGRLHSSGNQHRIIEECVDVILAVANMVAYYGVNDLTQDIIQKKVLNECRGYEYEREEA